MDTPARRPAGTSAGGQFTAKDRAEPDVDLGGSSRINMSAVPPSQVKPVLFDLARRYRVGLAAPSKTLQEIVESTPGLTKVRVMLPSGKTAHAIVAADDQGRHVLIPVRKATWDILDLPAPK